MHQFIANCGRFCWHANGACSTDLCWQQWALGLQQPFASFSTVAIFRMDFLHSAPPAVFSCPIEAMRIAVKTVAKLAKLLWQKWCAAVADFRLFRIAISLCSLLCFFFFCLQTVYLFERFVCTHSLCACALVSVFVFCGFTLLRWIIHLRVQIDRLRAIRSTRQPEMENFSTRYFILFFFR